MEQVCIFPASNESFIQCHLADKNFLQNGETSITSSSLKKDQEDI